VNSSHRFERRLAERYHLHGDLSAREQLIVRLLPLARKIAARYAQDEDSRTELFQVASVALVQAVDRFDLSRGTSLASYVVPTMVGEVRRHFRDQAWSVHISRDQHDRVMAARSTLENLWQELGRAPTAKDLAEALGISREQAVEMFEVTAARRAVSLDAPREGADIDDAAEPLVAQLRSDDEGYERVIDRGAVERGLAGLTDRERQLVRLRFGQELKQREIAERLNVSQMHVSRLLRRTVDRLRTLATAGT
jgi:RNA polymerase sigma-B factor